MNQHRKIDQHAMAQMLDRFSNFFYMICKETGGIDGLLHQFFAFLLYKTDFFIENTRPGEKQGFPPGDAKKMILDVFDQYQQQAWKRKKRVPRKVYDRNLKKLRDEMQRQQAAKAAKEAKAKAAKAKKAEEAQVKKP